MKFLVGLLVGFGLGVAAGLLLAPQPGEDTRSQIGEQGIMLRDRSQGLVGEFADRARSRFNEALAQGNQAYQRTKEELGEIYTRTKSGEI